MSFSIFEDTRARTKEYISVTENNTFGLPRTFIDKQGITPEHKAVILYDPDEMKIALHFTLLETKFGIAVRIPNNTQGGMIAAKAFFELKSINTKIYSGRYSDFEVIPLRNLGFDKPGNAYVIKLVQKQQKMPSSIDIEDIGDEPINLDDIPF